MLTHITHITLFVADQAEALAWYMKLGFVVHTDVQFGESRWLTISFPDQKTLEVALVLALTDDEKKLVGKQGVSDKPVMSFETTNCRGDYEQLQQQGVSFVEAPVEHPWGVAVAFFDLYGNMLYMCQSRLNA